MRGYIVAGIGTEVGKTVVSAIFVQHLGADYWKPVQAGGLENSDTRIVRDLAPGGGCFHPEAYRLEQAMSPHAAAGLEGLTLLREKMALPQSANTLIVEPAGGLMVPLAPGLTNIDLMQDWNLPVVLVSVLLPGQHQSHAVVRGGPGVTPYLDFGPGLQRRTR